MTPDELSIERDWLLEHGRSVEEAEAMQAAPAAFTALRALSREYEWARINYRVTNVDHACRECVPHSNMLIPGFQCARHLALWLLDRPAARTGPEGGTE